MNPRRARAQDPPLDHELDSVAEAARHASTWRLNREEPRCAGGLCFSISVHIAGVSVRAVNRTPRRKPRWRWRTACRAARRAGQERRRDEHGRHHQHHGHERLAISSIDRIVASFGDR